MVYPTLKLNLIDSNVSNLIELNDTDFQTNPVMAVATSSKVEAMTALVTLIDSYVSQYYNGYLDGLDDGTSLNDLEM